MSPDPAPDPCAQVWNFDIAAAPRGDEKIVTGRISGDRAFERRVHVRRQIFAAASCGVVTVSYWLPEQERWCMFPKAVPPIAWLPWEEGRPLPRHPLSG